MDQYESPDPKFFKYALTGAKKIQIEYHWSVQGYFMSNNEKAIQIMNVKLQILNE